MVYTSSFGIALGPSFTGISDLRAQLVDTTGASTGSAVSTGFTEIGNGFYLWNYAAFPTGHRGGVKFYSNASPSTFLAFASINPEEIESVGTRVLTGTRTYDDAQRLLLASQGAKTSGAVAGAPGTFTIRDVGDTKDAVVSQYDSNGNRLTVTLDLTP